MFCCPIGAHCLHVFVVALTNRITGRRPELLLDGEFERLPAALAKLAAAFPASDVGKMVAAQPLLLVEDIDIIIDELRRCVPSRKTASVSQPILWGGVG